MTIGARKVIGVGALLGAVVLVGVVSWAGGLRLGLVAAMLVLLAGGLLLAQLLLSSERRLRRLIGGSRQSPETATPGSTRGESDVAERLAELERTVRESWWGSGPRVVQLPEAHAEQLLRAVQAGTARLETAQDQLGDRLERLVRNEYRRVEDLLALALETGLLGWLPSLRDEAASPDFHRYVHRFIREHEPELVLASGSDASTLVAASALARNGRGRVVALERSDADAETTRDLLKQAGLDRAGRVVVAPLVEIALGGESYVWHDLHHLDADVQDIDLVLMTVPAQGGYGQNRYPALPLLRDRLSPSAVLVLGDMERAAEEGVLRRWQAEVDGLVIEEIDHEKGTAIVRPRG